jgi:hypothetical protein
MPMYVRVELGTEIRYEANMPEVGGILRRNGEEWKVIALESDMDGDTVATVELVASEEKLRPAESE